MSIWREFPRTRLPIALVVSVVIVLGACDGARDPAASSGPRTSPATATATETATETAADDLIHLVRVATLEQPLALAIRPGDSALYVAEKTGKVIAVRDGEPDPDPVLDLTGEVSLGGEQGLLGLAFSPSGRFLYVNYTDTAGDTHVTGFSMRHGDADPASRRDVLFVDQPFSNHNGGHLVFGPDGYLYIGLGDGGSGGDPFDNGQSLATLLGKMLRIDPRPNGALPYVIPPDNPFVGRPDARPEIWAYGLRNPWRYSFDRTTGDLWIGDVGQSAWEEIDMQPAASVGGENYGWDRLEGSHPFDGADAPEGAVPPVFEYSHENGGCVVTGGSVYRGTDIPILQGRYVFADFCLGELEAISFDGERVTDHIELGPHISNLSSFAEDAAGELYAMSLDGGLFKLAP